MSAAPEPEVPMPENMMGQIFTYNNVGSRARAAPRCAPRASVYWAVLQTRAAAQNLIVQGTDRCLHLAKLLLLIMRSQFVDGVAGSSGGIVAITVFYPLNKIREYARIPSLRADV